MKYPVGGPREPVYALMRGLGFSERRIYRIELDAHLGLAIDIKATRPLVSIPAEET